eukprot:5749254-Pleurochrysis_carterae.AAC.12
MLAGCVVFSCSARIRKKDPPVAFRPFQATMASRLHSAVSSPEALKRARPLSCRLRTLAACSRTSTESRPPSPGSRECARRSSSTLYDGQHSARGDVRTCMACVSG